MKLYCVALLCLVYNFCYSQKANPEDIKKLIDLTIDTERIDFIKQVTIYDALEIEKEGMNKDLDKIKEEFYKELNVFYQVYTQDEIAKMVEFYSSIPGNKLAEDLRMFSVDNFPVYEEWIKRVLSYRDSVASIGREPIN